MTKSQQTNNIIHQYVNEKLSGRKIEKNHSLSRFLITKILKENGVTMRPQYKRSWCNENYFERIDTEEAKAYLLGFILADGCIDDVSSRRTDVKWQPSLRLQIQNQDSYILELLKKETDASTKITFLSTRNICSFHIISRKLCSDLISLGITPRKTFTAKFPSFEKIPKHLFHHFLRGLFDGDGCITSTVEHGKPNPSFSFDICGTLNICKGVARTLADVVISEDAKRKPYKQGNIYRTYYHKSQSIKKIYNYLYKDACFFLKRKQNKFREVFNFKIIRKKSYITEDILPVL